jgi:hypothetical protein
MENETPTTDTPALSLDDIANAVQVIDHAADQGAFKSWKTIEQVLLVRQRLKAFLEAAAAQRKDSEPEAEAAAE